MYAPLCAISAAPGPQPISSTRMPGTNGSASSGSLALPIGLVGLLGLVVAAMQVAESWERGDWLSAAGIVLAALAALAAVLLLAHWLRRRELVDPRLVQSKLAGEACRVELRLAVFAPAFADPGAVRGRLEQLIAAFRAYGLGSGNSLSVRCLSTDRDLRVLVPVRRPSLLNVRELAGLWHLPQCEDDVPFVERTTARRRLPLPATVAQARAEAAGSASPLTRTMPCPCRCPMACSAGTCWRSPRRAAASRVCCCAWCTT